MSVDLLATYQLDAPAGIDGFGNRAVLNNSASAYFVGYCYDFSTALDVRKSSDPRPGLSGGVFGSFHYGERSVTLDVLLARASTYALSNARADLLCAAADAISADGTLLWTESGREATQILYRAEQSPRGPDKEGHVLLSLTSQESLILGNTQQSASPGSGLTNSGKHATFPTIEMTVGASGTVVISRTSPSPTETLTLTIGGAGGLTASSACVVDFGARTVLQGSTHKESAVVVVPASIWWAMAPGANTISVTGASPVQVKWRNAWVS